MFGSEGQPYQEAGNALAAPPSAKLYTTMGRGMQSKGQQWTKKCKSQ
jgi:hypothetical protein